MYVILASLYLYPLPNFKGFWSIALQAQVKCGLVGGAPGQAWFVGYQDESLASEGGLGYLLSVRTPLEMTHLELSQRISHPGRYM